ncbi:DNA polymerase II [Methanoculleus taiwanensis]|uniref:DNA polymerase II small subunit n=1 Tax=Methanoculleus taiwanensis TaxID=1550565 RepID=A0A498H1W9_9EURY|nr:DNA-directed DNA polymerase II small subunit [Methanoculleus taiwanensis]RXE56842.1 DNA polymerase II [Methanoculleus taiwanensis]
MLAPREIVQRFLDTKLQVHPDVVSYIREQDDPALIDRILESVPGDALVVSVNHIPGLKKERDGTRFFADPELEIIVGSPGTAGSVAGYEDAIHYFRDRYNKLSAMIRSRTTSMPIEALTTSPHRYRDQECTVIGMAVEVRTTAKGHRLVEIEDPTGTILVLFNKSRDDTFADAERILPDEVLGVKGKLSSDGGLFFAEQLFRPDIPIKHAPYTSDRPGKAVLISDVHVGSDTFLEAAWNRFADWLQDTDASYLLVAGDLVDGIGIYPGQEHELTIKNIYEQYDAFAGMLRDLPSRLKIVLAPGNHDVVRMAEPQPALPPEFTGNFPANCQMVENPCVVSLQGVRVMMYHGRSIDDMIGLIPGASYERPGEIMEEMLKRRLLASTYGMRTPIAAAKMDRLVIDPLPEILHTGHVHICGITKYRGVLGVNTGTWQAQTAFQKQMNINPTPARAVVIDLQTLQPEVLDFS